MGTIVELERLATTELITQAILIIVMIIDAIMLYFYFVRALLGPKLTDRLAAVNMIGTIVIIMIAILSYLYDASYLIDICIIYAMISFLAMIVLSKVYMGAYDDAEEDADEKDQLGEGEDA